MKTYRGIRTDSGCSVTVNGRWLAAGDSFNWGDYSPESRRLALAILADCCGREIARCFFDAFLCEMVSGWSGDEWTIDEPAIGRWLASREAFV